MQLVLTATQESTLAVSFRDRKGNDAEVDGQPTWTIQPEGVASLNVSEDGKSVVVVAEEPGEALITMRADADLGSGAHEVIGTMDLVVTAGEATVVELVASEPVEQEEEATNPDEVETDPIVVEPGGEGVTDPSGEGEPEEPEEPQPQAQAQPRAGAAKTSGGTKPSAAATGAKKPARDR